MAIDTANENSMSIPGYRIEDGIYVLSNPSCSIHHNITLHRNGIENRLVYTGIFQNNELIEINQIPIRVQRYRCPMCRKNRHQSEIWDISALVEVPYSDYSMKLYRFLLQKARTDGVKATIELCRSMGHIINKSTISRWKKKEEQY